MVVFRVGVWLTLTAVMALAAGEETFTDRTYGYVFRYLSKYVLEAARIRGYFAFFREGRMVISATVENLARTGRKEMQQSADP